jgi:hypothetical protein
MKMMDMRIQWGLACMAGDVDRCRRIESVVAQKMAPSTLKKFISWTEKNRAGLEAKALPASEPDGPVADSCDGYTIKASEVDEYDPADDVQFHAEENADLRRDMREGSWL